MEKLLLVKKKIVNYATTNVLFLSFVLTSLLNGMLVRHFSVGGIFSYSPIMADLVFILVVGSFGYFITPKHQFKYYMAMSIFLTAICAVNSIYYNNYMTYASLSMIATSSQLSDIADAVITEVFELKDLLYLIGPIVLIVVNMSLKKHNYYTKVETIENGKVRALSTMIAAIISLGLFMITITGTDLSRLGKQWNREYVVMKFGIYIYQVNDVVSSISSSLAPLFGYDEAMKEFREFYDNKEDTTKTNKYTNIFKGKNLLVIHAESIQNFLLNKTINGKEVTPNLNRLASEGIYASNFYAQESIGTSSDTEFTFNTSLMPATNGTVFVSYFDRDYVTIPKLLKEQGYYSFSMHANKAAFWNRKTVHKSFGYDHFYAYTDAYKINKEDIIGLGLNDKSFFKQSVPYIKEISDTYQNFYGTVIMLTNHTPFTDIENYSDFDVTMKYVDQETLEEKVAPYLEGTTMGSYIKSVHYADEAIGEFINELDEAGLLENTVIVIYGDHDAKLKKSEFNRYYNYDPYNDDIKSKDSEDYVTIDSYTYELNRKTPFIIWTKNKKFNVEITEVMGMYDALPTLGNMFGFKSDYALGHDIFSVKENVVVFPDGDWLTNKMYYNSQKEEGKLLKENETVSTEYINKYTTYADKLISVSNDIIVHDLIKRSKDIKEAKDELLE